MATEKRLIDANFLDDRCRRQISDDWNKKVAPVSWSEAYKEFLDDVWDAPIVDAVEVVHGRWECEHETWGKLQCSNCKKEALLEKSDGDCGTILLYVTSNYCPNCGEKMDGDGNG